MAGMVEQREVKFGYAKSSYTCAQACMNFIRSKSDGMQKVVCCARSKLERVHILQKKVKWYSTNFPFRWPNNAVQNIHCKVQIANININQTTKQLTIGQNVRLVRRFVRLLLGLGRDITFFYHLRNTELYVIRQLDLNGCWFYQLKRIRCTVVRLLCSCRNDCVVIAAVAGTDGLLVAAFVSSMRRIAGLGWRLAGASMLEIIYATAYFGCANGSCRFGSLIDYGRGKNDCVEIYEKIEIRMYYNVNKLMINHKGSFIRPNNSTKSF